MKRQIDKDNNEEKKNVRIRVVRLSDDEEEIREEPAPENGRKRNTELSLLTCVFSAMFLLLAGYLVWFNVRLRPKISSNPYNTKQDTSSEGIIRGPIVAEDGTILASTSVDYTGNEVRYYPYSNIYAHTVGYGTNGRSGLEATSNNILLTSHSPLLEQIRSAGSDTKVQGDTLVVTLNHRLQQAAYYALGSFNGAVVALEPDSGRVLAMVSKPDFDPNSISYIWDDVVSDNSSGLLLNRATQGLYPPGSTFKILTTLAWLRQNGGDDSSFLYDCQGMVSRNDVNITCYNGAVHGNETLKQAFANSCNTAFATIGLSLNRNDFRTLCESFLFNHTLPTDILHSQSKFFLRKDSPDGDVMTTSIGQGDTLVTPLHMAMITSAVANAGVLMKPYMIARVESPEGEVVSETKPEIFGELMTVDEAQTLGEYMQATVQEGTGAALSYNSYSVAGKTGSAEYDANGVTGTHSWFVGYSNVDDPDLVLAVIAEDGGTGSATAVPIAQQIFDAYYYG